MSLEARSNSAIVKRAEQLKSWEASETNREPVSPKQKFRKIKFSSGCVFLAACAAGDKEEVIKLLENGADINTCNVDGLTALHQACIDDNLDMVEFLVEHGADVNRGDNEGWTPLHATASCGFSYIAKYLIEKGADVARVNNDGELAVDIAECQKMEDLLKEEIDRLGIDCDMARNEEEMTMLRDAKEWLSSKSPLVHTPHPKNGATPLHVASAKGYSDVMKILFQCAADIDAQDIDGWTPIHAAAHWGQREACRLLVENFADMEAKNFVGQTAFDLADSDMLSYLEDLKKKQDKDEVMNRRQAKKRIETHNRPTEAETPSKVKKVEVEISTEEKNETKVSDHIDLIKSSDLIGENELPLKKVPQNEELNVKDDKNKINISTVNVSNTNKTSTPLVSSQVNNQQPREQPLRRSFVPPVRDEESETQRKAHAKRVRETRRSTQGVTLEEIKSAEQFVKKKNQPNINSNDADPNAFSTTVTSVAATITTASPTVITRETDDSNVIHERRPSWRLKVDNNSAKFKLEDATKTSESPSTPSFIRRNNATNSVPRPSSAPVETETTVTLSLRRPKSVEEKEQDKENDIRNAQASLATQATIQRRRRPKRRSTGVVSFDNMDDLEQEKESSAGGENCEDSTKTNHQDSGTERSSRSRIGSTSDIRNENGEIDYKKLYEQQLVENDRLKDKLRKSEEELRETKQTLERINCVTSKNSLSELEKRERRAMERKLSEMEEELKNLENFKTENQRLKDENGALIRVISKLSK